MIAYRVEIWCDGIDGNICEFRAGAGEGIPHDDPSQLPGLAENLKAIRRRAGWRIDDGVHLCPGCIAKIAARKRDKVTT